MTREEVGSQKLKAMITGRAEGKTEILMNLVITSERLRCAGRTSKQQRGSCGVDK